jgi:hypothetical protein
MLLSASGAGTRAVRERDCEVTLAQATLGQALLHLKGALAHHGAPLSPAP